MDRRRFIAFFGGAIALPCVAATQQKAMPVIGLLRSTSPDLNAEFIAAFKQGLSDTGYVEGQNVAFEYRWAEGHYDRLPALAADLVSRKVDVIVASGTAGIKAAKRATPTVPIVFFGGGDLVAAGLVASLARPGGNLTGISIMATELNPKRFELLSELVPGAKVIAVLVNPSSTVAETTIKDIQDTARAKGVRLAILKARTESEIDATFAALAPSHADALILASDPFFNSQREQLVALAARHAVPAMWEWREFVAAGGLISYGISVTDSARKVGVYAGRILKGAKPADLPIQQPRKFELAVNLKTAKALGLTVPPSILVRADEVIE